MSSPKNPVPPEHCWHENGYATGAEAAIKVPVLRKWVCCNCGTVAEMSKVKADMGVHGKRFAVPQIWEWAAPPKFGCEPK